ncbi:polymorphic toxin type 15 domain-containing protein [Cystobacter fuscus]|uniref:polymorphic toxin type 15 domain-containing protein n=1 Tax=Cystobacter fuscus TaxID=43 RepID=UPI0037BEBD04
MADPTRPSKADAGRDQLAGSPVQKCSSKHWVELDHRTEYKDDHGQVEPAAGTPYRVTFGDGSCVDGTLDQNGFARFVGISEGTVHVEYEPDIDEKVAQLKQQLQQGLNEILTVEREEYRRIDEQLEKALTFGLNFPGSNSIAKGSMYTAAFLKGLWNGATGILEFAWDVIKGTGQVLYEVGLRINPITAPEKFKEDLQALKAAYTQLGLFLDEDLEAYVILMTEPETYGMFKKFGAELISAQHYLEMTEGGGELVLDIALAIITGGAGAASNTRHLGKIKKLKGVVDELVDALKRMKRRKKKQQDKPDRRLITRVQLQVVPCFCPYSEVFDNLSPEEKKAYLKEYSQQVQRQEDAINNMTVEEYRKARDDFEDAKKKGVTRPPGAAQKQRSFRRKFKKKIRDSITMDIREKNPEMGARAAKAEAGRRADEAMANLDALHESDGEAGGWNNPEIKNMGNRSVNRAIGGSWNQKDRLSKMDEHAAQSTRNGLGKEKMKVKLDVCRSKGSCP